MQKKGHLIVIEGIDGAGTETQSKALLKLLKEKGLDVERFEYPDYEGPIGKVIHEYLHKKYELSVDVQFLLYSTDMIKDKERIKRVKENNGIVVLDRYITTTMAYQGFKGFPVEKALKYANLFEIPKPDLIVYLDVSSETSMDRKFKEKNKLDRHESQKEFLEGLRGFYKKLIDSNIFGKWHIIDGEKSKEEVTAEILKLIKKELNIDLKSRAPT